MEFFDHFLLTVRVYDILLRNLNSWSPVLVLNLELALGYGGATSAAKCNHILCSLSIYMYDLFLSSPEGTWHRPAFLPHP